MRGARFGLGALAGALAATLLACAGSLPAAPAAPPHLEVALPADVVGSAAAPPLAPPPPAPVPREPARPPSPVGEWRLANETCDGTHAEGTEGRLLIEADGRAYLTMAAMSCASRMGPLALRTTDHGYALDLSGAPITCPDGPCIVQYSKGAQKPGSEEETVSCRNGRRLSRQVPLVPLVVTSRTLRLSLPKTRCWSDYERVR
jgi:hypothetical protein